MYQLVTGPLAWLSFGVFFIGMLVRVVLYIKGLDTQLDRVTYRVNVAYGLRGALRSVVRWLIPFGTRSWRINPGFTLVFFLFHVCLIGAPLFVQAHSILLKERWGFGLPTVSDATADLMTAGVVVAGVLLLLRRIALPEVRFISTAYDYLLLAIAVAPFLTGFLAYHSAPGYRFWLIAHILCGQIMLVAIPLTKLNHFALFFLSRAQIGMDFGIKRGGMKGTGMPW